MKHHQSKVAVLHAKALTTVSLIALTASTLGGSLAYAQNANQSPGDIDEVVVTGSRIVREGYEAPTPLTVVDTSAIQTGSTSNIADFVNTMPVFAGSGSPTSQTAGMSSGTGGSNTLNLRNLGTARTLVLLDGQRSVGSLLTGVVDINVFPEQLVQRVDVVTGGASAVYGSDAVAGVVNFILDKNFTGMKGEISAGITTYGDDFNYKIAASGGWGFAGGRGHVLISGQEVDKEGILDSPSRDWAYTGIGQLNNPTYTATNGQPRILVFPDSVSNTSLPYGIVVSGPLKGTAFGPGGRPYQFHYGDVVSDPYMHGGDWKTSDVRERRLALDPSDSRQNAYLRIAYDLSDNINVFASAAWAREHTVHYGYPQFNPGNAASGANALKLDNPFIPTEVRDRMIALGVTTLTIGSFNFDLPTQGFNDVRQVNRYVVGANGNFDALGSNWTWDAYFQHGYNRASLHGTNVTYRDRYTLAIDAVRNANGQIVCRSSLTTNNNCQPYNLLGQDVNSTALINYIVGSPYSYQHATQNVWEATFGGEPFSIWAGPVSLSLNFAYRQEKATGIADADAINNNYFAGNYRPLIGKYNVKEAAVETVIPLANGKPWADSWDLNAAVRATDYSTSGYVTTWKIGTTYAPIPEVRFRLTQSRDIRAPTLNDLFQTGFGAAQQLGLDRFTNSSPAIRSFSVGNPGLRPEKADTTGLGVVLAPSFVDGLTVSVDYWKITIKDAVGSISVQNTVDLCFFGTRPDLCQFITRLPPTGVAPNQTIGAISVVQSTSINVATEDARGIDFEGSYRWGADQLVSSWSGNFNLHANATLYLRKYTNPGYAGAVLTQTVGENRGAGPPDWRMTTTLTYNLDPITTSLTARGISAGTISNLYFECTTGCPTSTAQRETINFNRVAGAWYFDASVSYNFDIGGAETTAFFNVRNIANKDPAQIPPTSVPYVFLPTNLGLYDTLGRNFRAGLRFRL